MVLKFGAKQRHVIIIVDAVYYATTASQCDRRCQVCAERNSCARGGARSNVCKCDAQSLTFCLAYITQHRQGRSPRSVPCRAVPCGAWAGSITRSDWPAHASHVPTSL